jgi:hypothetical protein
VSDAKSNSGKEARWGGEETREESLVVVVDRLDANLSRCLGGWELLRRQQLEAEMVILWQQAQTLSIE